MSGPRRPNIVEALQLAGLAVHHAVHDVGTVDADAPDLTIDTTTTAAVLARFDNDCRVRFLRLPFGADDRPRWYRVGERGPDVVVTQCTADVAADLEELYRRT